MSGKSEFIKGVLAGIFCFSFWGIAPIFWKLFENVSSLELLFHRVIWGFLTLMTVIIYKGEFKELLKSLSNKRLVGFLLLSGICISSNWFLFTYAITTNHIVEASLGYFVNPLMNVFIGWLVLKERLTPRKWMAILLAFVGVGVMFVGKIDGLEISLGLSGTFALYGLIRKQLDIRSEFGLIFELLLTFIPATLILFTQRDHYQFFSSSFNFKLLFISCGIITVAPLLLFIYAAKRLQYSQVGILQYLAPFLQLLIGTMVYHEPFTRNHLISFVLIWSAIIIFLSQEMAAALKFNKVGKNV